MTRALLIAWIALLAAPPARAQSGEPREVSSFDYLYVRAHEGSASGGHAAIRFGAQTFDFQHDRGLLRPRRDDSLRFQHTYRTLQNRSIERTRIAATPETVAALRDSFERRLLAQGRQLALQDDLRRDVALLEGLLGAASGAELRVAVRGAALFAESPDGREQPPAALAQLRAAIEARRPTWLADRRAEAERNLRELALEVVDVDAVVLDPLRYPVVPDSLSRRAEHALAALRALDVLERPRPLRAEALVQSADDATLALDAATLLRLREARTAQFAAAAALAASPRPDWGEALLLAMARLATMEASISSQRWVVLDALPANAPTLEVTAARRALLPALLEEAHDDLAHAQERFRSATGFREADWSALEASASRYAALRAARDGAAMLRIAAGSLVPEARADVAFSPRPATSAAALERALAAAREAEQRYRRALEVHYRYDLVTRNCVAEIFRTIEIALAGEAGAAGVDAAPTSAAWLRSESLRRLGGYIDPVARANFVPLVSSRHVRARWTVLEAAHLPSYREYQVAALRTREGAWRAALREASVFTSSLSVPTSDADFFVFFTDGRWPLRPLLGSANLAAALARSGLGLVQLPFDAGRGLRAGLEGALWSLPELFFVNVRKGRNEYVPPPLRPPPG